MTTQSITFSLLYQPSSGLVVATFRPKIPATLPAAEAVIEGAIITKSDIVFSVPSFVEVNEFRRICFHFIMKFVCCRHGQETPITFVISKIQREL